MYGCADQTETYGKTETLNLIAAFLNKITKRKLSSTTVTLETFWTHFAEYAVSVGPLIGSFRLDYEYEIEYEYEFWISNLWRFQSPRSSCWF